MALNIEFNGSTTDTVLEVIGFTHGSMGFDGDTHTLNRIVEVLEAPENADCRLDGHDVSYAALEVREILWNAYSGGGASAAATCSLFHALGREKELGHLVEDVHYSEYNRVQISENLLKLRTAAK